MSQLERRLTLLEDLANPLDTRSMSDAELALRLFSVFNGPDTVDQDLVDLLDGYIRSNAL